MKTAMGRHKGIDATWIVAVLKMGAAAVLIAAPGGRKCDATQTQSKSAPEVKRFRADIEPQESLLATRYVTKISAGAPFVMIPELRSAGVFAASVAAGIAVYYFYEPPNPGICRPAAIDKWRHCYVGCDLSESLPMGAFSASLLAVVKEIRDKLDGGVFSWPDVRATLRGTWDCAGGDSCESCCCGFFGANH